MIITQLHLTPAGEWLKCSRAKDYHKADLAFVFWDEISHDAAQSAARKLRELCPRAIIIGCSTAGVIQDRLLLEESVSATLVSFSHTAVLSVTATQEAGTSSADLGRHLGRALPPAELQHVFILATGLSVNGCTLTAGLAEALPDRVSITGGLAADGERFDRTWILHGEDILDAGAVAVGFYGTHLRVGQGTRGGWEPFGPERLVTAAQGTTLLAVDGESALKLYERYLGRLADNLPASGHLFPLHLQEPGRTSRVVRTILGADRERQTLSFGGDIPVGSMVQLMRSRPDTLIDGAGEAGRAARVEGGPALAVVVSCVGRRMLLGQYTEDEIEQAADGLGPQAVMTGFYSYGEIAPDENSTCCLHNQTMTITVFGEED